MRNARSVLLALLAGLFVLLCSPVVSRAQVVGMITGMVKDSSGAVIPNATVVITNMGTGLSRTLQTDTTGLYAAEALPVGNYEVAVSATGFQKEVQSNVALNVADRLGINFALKVGHLTQTVEVVGGAPLVQTESGEQSAVVSPREIAEMPLFGRNPNLLQALMPGASKTAPDELGVAGSSQMGFAVNGFVQNMLNGLAGWCLQRGHGK